MTFTVHKHCEKMATKDNTEAPWYAAFPEPSSQPENIEPVQVYELLDQQSISSDKARDFLLVDVRRTDWQGGTVESSINLPAHSFYPTRKIVYDLCKQAGIKNVIFYCGQSAIARFRYVSLGLITHCRQVHPTDVVPGAPHGCKTS
jgi:arsenical-resistance protein 2